MPTFAPETAVIEVQTVDSPILAAAQTIVESQFQRTETITNPNFHPQLETIPEFVDEIPGGKIALQIIQGETDNLDFSGPHGEFWQKALIIDNDPVLFALFVLTGRIDPAEYTDDLAEINSTDKDSTHNTMVWDLKTFKELQATIVGLNAQLYDSDNPTAGIAIRGSIALDLERTLGLDSTILDPEVRKLIHENIKISKAIIHNSSFFNLKAGNLSAYSEYYKRQGISSFQYFGHIVQLQRDIDLFAWAEVQNVEISKMLSKSVTILSRTGAKGAQVNYIRPSRLAPRPDRSISESYYLEIVVGANPDLQAEKRSSLESSLLVIKDRSLCLHSSPEILNGRFVQKVRDIPRNKEIPIDQITGVNALSKSICYAVINEAVVIDERDPEFKVEPIHKVVDSVQKQFDATTNQEGAIGEDPQSERLAQLTITSFIELYKGFHVNKNRLNEIMYQLGAIESPAPISAYNDPSANDEQFIDFLCFTIGNGDYQNGGAKLKKLLDSMIIHDYNIFTEFLYFQLENKFPEYPAPIIQEVAKKNPKWESQYFSKWG